MFQFIKGKVVDILPDSIILENNGLGYQINFKQQSSIQLNQEVLIYTYLAVRQEDLSLYGFLSKMDLTLFLQLLKVKGVGPKSALNIFAHSSSHQLINAIENSDTAYLKTLPGIGQKGASQLILDLKGKLVETSTNETADLNDIQEVVAALKSMGYSNKEISAIEKKLVHNKDLTIQEQIKEALKII